MSDSGEVKFVTGDNLRSYIGAGTGSGSVTSVGITETGDALTITNSPITGSGDINIAGAGTSSQVILGDLTLATLPTSDTGVPAILSDGASPSLIWYYSCGGKNFNRSRYRIGYGYWIRYCNQSGSVEWNY